MPNDMDDMVQNDAKKAKQAFRNYKRGGSVFDRPGKLLESIMWTFTAISVLGMIVVLPWVGSDGFIPGRAWIGVGCLAVVFFGGVAFCTRWFRTSINASQVDNSVERRLSRKR